MSMCTSQNLSELNTLTVINYIYIYIISDIIIDAQ